MPKAVGPKTARPPRLSLSAGRQISAVDHGLPYLIAISPPPATLSQSGKAAAVPSKAALGRILHQGPARAEKKRLHVGPKGIPRFGVSEGIRAWAFVGAYDHHRAGIRFLADADAFVASSKCPQHTCDDRIGELPLDYRGTSPILTVTRRGRRR